MKMWRVYQILRNGKQKCMHRSFDRSKCETVAFMTALGVAMPDCSVVEMRSPEGRTWRYEMPRPSTPQEMAAADARLKALPPEELEQRKKEAKARVRSYFEGERPKPSPMVERAMERFREKLAERSVREAAEA